MKRSLKNLIQLCTFFIACNIFSVASFGQTTPKNLKEADSSYFKGDWKAASEGYKKILGDTSRNAVMWQRLGYANQMQGNWEEAIKAYEKSAKFNPPLQLKAYMFGNALYVYNKLNKGAEALAFLKDPVENGTYANFQVLESMEMFSSLRNSPEYKAIWNKARNNAYPCLTAPHRNDFDFWVGEWDVYAAGTSSIIGKSSITKEDGGCLIIEHFESTLGPGSGHSMNFYDPFKGKWEQIYVGNIGGQQVYVNGEYRDSAMRFTYEFVSPKNNLKTMGNFIFFNEGPNQFRQYNEFSVDGGKTYQVSYNFTYKRKQKQ